MRTRFYKASSLVPLLLAAGLGLAGCDYSDGQEKADEPVALTGDQQADAPADTVKASDDKATLDAAFRTAYGEAPPLTVHDDIDTLTVTPASLVETDFGPVLISTAAMQDGCHACSGYLSVHYLKRDGDGFALVKAYDKAIPGSDWGNPPTDWSVRGRFAANPSIYSERGGIAQGYACASGMIHELSPDGPREIAAFPLMYSDEGAVTDGSATSIEGEIADIVPRKSFDIDYKGTRDATARYLLEGSSYKLQGKSPVEGC